MKFYKKAFLVLCILLTSCAHTRSSSVSLTPWLDSFEPSGSFCFDAYVVNSASSGCKEWTTREVSGAIEIRCSSSSSSEENFWNQSTFILAPPNVAQTIAGLQPLCGDMSTVLGVINSQ